MNGIQHPETFYNYGTSWYNGYDLYNNLWSMDNTTTSYNDNAVVKTIYDPCPAGFHMPASNAFTGFTATVQYESMVNVSGAWDNGWNFNNKRSSPDATVFFPASASRDYRDGSLSYVYGNNYWAAHLNDVGGGCCLDFYRERYVYTQVSYGTSGGCSVRPVAEPKTKVTPKTPGSTEEDWSNNEDIDAGNIDI